MCLACEGSDISATEGSVHILEGVLCLIAPSRSKAATENESSFACLGLVKGEYLTEGVHVDDIGDHVYLAVRAFGDGSFGR